MAFGDSSNLLSNFDGADENPLSEAGRWGDLNTNGPDLQLVSHQVTSGGATTGERYWLVDTAMGPDVEAYLTIATLPGDGNAIRLYARGQQPGSNTNDGYEIRYNQITAATDEILIERCTNAVLTVLATFTQDLIAGDKLGISILGNRIEAWFTTGGVWTLAGSAVDNTYTAAGHVAMGVRGTTGRVDNVYAGELNSLASPVHFAGRGAA